MTFSSKLRPPVVERLSFSLSKKNRWYAGSNTRASTRRPQLKFSKRSASHRKGLLLSRPILWRRRQKQRKFLRPSSLRRDTLKRRWELPRGQFLLTPFTLYLLLTK